MKLRESIYNNKRKYNTTNGIYTITPNEGNYIRHKMKSLKVRSVLIDGLEFTVFNYSEFMDGPRGSCKKLMIDNYSMKIRYVRWRARDRGSIKYH